MSKIMPLQKVKNMLMIDADVVLKGNMSAVEQGHYDQFISGFVEHDKYRGTETKDMPKTSISTGNFKFSPQFLEDEVGKWPWVNLILLCKAKPQII